MAVKRRTVDPSSTPSSIWTTENELKLFKAALKFKPAGVIKHFNMALIHNELVKGGMKDITPSAIWDQLNLIYNLEAADKLEKSSLNLEHSEVEFSLPKKDFHDVMSEMKKSDSDFFEIKEEPVVVKINVVKKPNPPVPTTETPKSNSKTTAETPKSSSKTTTETPKSNSKRPAIRPTRSTPASAPSSAKRRK